MKINYWHIRKSDYLRGDQFGGGTTVAWSVDHDSKS